MPKSTIALAALVLGACATKLFYQRLDFFINWRLTDYVTLDDQQQPQFKRAFGEVWQWHRAHELPLYARDLRELNKALDGGAVTPAQVAAHSAQFQAHWETLMARTVEAMCPIVQTLSDKQAAEILEQVDDGLEDFHKEYVAPPEAEVRRKGMKRTAKWIKRWTGPLNDAQEAMLKSWMERRLNISAAWLEQRRQWRDRFEQALAQRKDSADCAVFKPLFVTPTGNLDDKFERDLAYNERLWNELFAEVIASLDDRQRRRTHDELEEFAAQLEQLAAMPSR